uniref:Autophagy-related protein n=1 Tax=Palpitomonas bilix TaxID=652834 RepID=A0A7S3DI49_9EUKA|mmetsp:Transcript_37919/g.97900  ORF Transcript_37919/g.97900 Transcript_37919/m.97900 type:complete len:142 (+) Transcript_37919:319-744(+)|eukprot:CAMPEP_0113879400 /NCGR_PEP_ID=MMETSP0780_2-20120614/7220_1 /TAXON_ID=652834 /ORGANISM="Palpitomonas bilix" /LENGTH=141 /DNA_ID=CAMNT_0000865983 /DNA_START=192 /DNA_END=617 /DNA_ORIENTATION=- /assembly_acc=CAM_ASM_000599
MLKNGEELSQSFASISEDGRRWPSSPASGSSGVRVKVLFFDGRPKDFMDGVKKKLDKHLQGPLVRKVLFKRSARQSALWTIARKVVELGEADGIILMTEANSILRPGGRSVGDLFDQYKNEDDILVLFVLRESTFGASGVE